MKMDGVKVNKAASTQPIQLNGDICSSHALFWRKEAFLFTGFEAESDPIYRQIYNFLNQIDSSSVCKKTTSHLKIRVELKYWKVYFM
jgi:hypothetical protein